MRNQAAVFDFDVEVIARAAIAAAWKAWDAAVTEFRWPVHARPNFIEGFVRVSMWIHLARRASAVKRILN